MRMLLMGSKYLFRWYELLNLQWHVWDKYIYKNNTYRVREGEGGLTMTDPTPIAPVYDSLYSLKPAAAPSFGFYCGF